MVKVAILGFGVVGSGVAEVLAKNAAGICAKAGDEIELKYILDIIDFPGTVWQEKVIHDFSIIENDPEISIVVETIGGQKIAYEYTKRALLAGKNVVTSNKELVAERGVELIALARERNLNYLFEASVGGGIPIIRPLTQCLSANDLNEICGILNGTTNYILTRMMKEGVGFEETLKEAQALGYAEADPTADIDGHDACRKICILSDLAFGRHIPPALVHTEGIRNITAADMSYAKSMNCVIKLIARVVHREDGRLDILVAPHFVSKDSPLATVDDVYNGIVVVGDAIGEVMFYGRGAGKLPTASAVVADIIDVAKHFKARKFISWDGAVPGMVADVNQMNYAYFIRLRRSPSAAGAVLKVFGDIMRLPDGAEDMAFVTNAGPTGGVTAKLDLLRGLGVEVLSSIRVLR